MRKIILLTFIGIFISGNAMAGKGWKFGYNGPECIRYWEANQATSMDYYFCGKPNTKDKCADRERQRRNPPHYQQHGDKVEGVNGYTYWCCGGVKAGVSGEKQGRYIQGEDWIIKEETITRQLGNGQTCHWVQKTTVCGETIGTKCEEADPCESGQVRRNYQCVPACASGKLFASETSSACITCDTTNYQGPDKNHEYCVQCDPRTQIYDSYKKDCVNKSGMTAYYNRALKKCFACSGVDIFKQCVQLFNKPESDWQADKLYNSIAQECMID